MGANALQPPRVTVFGPDPLLSITIEHRGDEDDVHIHAAGQGVWASRMVAELGAHPVLCCLIGGETGATVRALLDGFPGKRRAIATTGSSGSYVIDRRDGERRLVAMVKRPAPQRHEVDDLVAATCASALWSDVLIICNPFPPEDIPAEAFESVAANASDNGIPVVVDLSSPRLEHTLAARPVVVKLNDWELAEYARGPIEGPLALEAMRELQRAGAGTVVMTRAQEPILVLGDDGESYEIVPPRFTKGFSEGCGDAMTGAIGAGLACGMDVRDALVLGAAAGTGNFLRHGLGTGSRAVVEELRAIVSVRPPSTAVSAPSPRTADVAELR